MNKNELLAIVEKNNFGETAVELSDGTSAIVTPCAKWGIRTPTCADDVEYWLVDDAEYVLHGSDSIDEIVKQINDYAARKAEHQDSRRELADYYAANIEGHSDRELYLGNELCGKLYEAFIAKNEGMSLTAYEDKYLDRVAAEVGCTAEAARAALDLSRAWDFYSDWYKDLYGHRPH